MVCHLCTRSSERGIALVVAVMTMLLMLALGAAAVLTTSSEALIASGFRAGRQALYAAEAGVESALADVAVAADWDAVRSGAAKSGFVDGVPGPRTLQDGSLIDVAAIARDHPGWHLYAHGFLEERLTGGEATPFYIVVLVTADTAPDKLKLRAEALGPRGVRRGLQVILAKSSDGVRLQSWQRVL